MIAITVFMLGIEKKKSKTQVRHKHSITLLLWEMDSMLYASSLGHAYSVVAVTSAGM